MPYVHVYHCDTNNEFLKLPMIFLLLVACNRGIRENGSCMGRERKSYIVRYTQYVTYMYMYYVYIYMFISSVCVSPTHV